PTTLGLCGIAPPAWMKGFDYSHYRINKQSKSNEPDSAFLQFVEPTGHDDSVDKPWRGLITKDNWKIVYFKNKIWLMFNLEKDPYEMVNLAHNPAYNKKRSELKNRLKKWIRETQDDFFLPK